MKQLEDTAQPYATSFGSVSYQEVVRYDGVNVEYGVFARRKIARREKIQGLDGYFAPAIEVAPAFSRFGSEKGIAKIMLRPGSVVNHSCEPNEILAYDGPTKSQTILRIETLRELKKEKKFL